MKSSRVALGLILSALLLAPIAAHGQDASPLPALDEEALISLCATNADDDDELDRCVEVVEAILPADPARVPMSDDEADLLTRAGEVVDDAVALAQDVDLPAAIEEVAGAAQDLDLGAAMDDLISSAGEVDLPALVDEVATAAGEIDIQETVDEVVSAAERVDLGATIEAGIETTEQVVEAATIWAEENSEAVCTGSSASLGVAAAGVVGYLTGSPGLALRAYEETERATADICETTLDS